MSKLRQLMERVLQWFDDNLEFHDKPMDPEIVDVLNFQQKLGHLMQSTPGHLTKRKLRERLECMREELNEFEKAIEAQDLEEQFDALIDLVYFAKGTANMLGLTSVWALGWLEVQRANMTKVPGVTKRGHAVDAVKPEGWQPPDHATILREAGYRRSMWTVNDQIYEGWCCDDGVHRVQ